MKNYPLARTKTLYINYETRSDANSGISTPMPWKRVLGMPGVSAGSTAALATFATGDTIYFKAGLTWMLRTWTFLFILLSLRAPLLAQVGSGPGWYQIANTKLNATRDASGNFCAGNMSYKRVQNSDYCSSVCLDPALRPDIQSVLGCNGLIIAWNGAVADQTNNRLILWGGGHNDYYGNEAYAFDLGTFALSRITEPSTVAFAAGDCPEALADGRPNSRHTYNGLAYIRHANRMFVFGGSKSPCGSLSNGTWTLDLSALTWTRMDPHAGSTPRANPGVVSDYDASTRKVFLHDTSSFWSYDFDTNAYSNLIPYGSFIDYHETAVVDPHRRLFIMMGGAAGSTLGGIQAISLDNPSVMQNWTTQAQGCDAIAAAAYPGLAYDPSSKLIVAWAGGDTVTLFNPDTKTCSTQIYPAGPGAQLANGTMGRFRYMESLNAFAVVNGPAQNAFILRLSTTEIDSSAPGRPTGLGLK